MGMDLAGRDQALTPCFAQTARTSSSNANAPRAACDRAVAKDAVSSGFNSRTACPLTAPSNPAPFASPGEGRLVRPS